jgi:hypothetical protein
VTPFIFNIHPSSSGGGSDNIPDSINWADISWDTGDSLGAVTSKQITGISGSIDLNVSEEETSPDNIFLYYRVDSSEITANITETPGSPWVQVVGSPGSTFTVNNNQWVTFSCWSSVTTKNATTISVYNASDSNVLLDTFTIQSNA